MSVPPLRLPRTSAVGAIIGALALSACGQADNAAVVDAAETPAAAPVVSVAASLAPDALMLRALECRSSLAPVRHSSDLLPADLMARVARTADVSFGDLIFGAGEQGLSMEARRDAHSNRRAMPRTAEEVTPDYIEYVSTCADILDRAASVLAADK